MAAHVHPTAIVDRDALLDHDVSIGPFCIIGAGAIIGSGTRLISHVTIAGNVRIGSDNTIHPYCLIGAEPQDLSYRGAPTWVTIGDRNVIREGCTIHRATEKEHGVTSVGSDNFIMGYCHLAHDVGFGSHITMANATMLCGHVRVQDFAIMSGMVGVHHFATIGSYSFISGMTRVSADVPPFMLVEGNPADVRCVNVVGLKRRGFSGHDIQTINEAHRLLYRMRMGAAQARQLLEAKGKFAGPVLQLFEFLDQQRQGRNGRARDQKRAAA